MKLGFRFVLLGAIAFFVYWIYTGQRTFEAPNQLLSQLNNARALYQHNKVLFTLAFLAAHLVASGFGLPGGCTTLNVLSGAMFGFWRGCALVYTITLLSACLSYCAAHQLKRLPFVNRHEKAISRLRAQIGSGGFLFLVALRLSPFLPFGVLNLALGLLGVHFWTFFSSTFVGIFFDVVLLNGFGATMVMAGNAPVYDGKSVVFTFFALLCALAIFRKIMGRRLGVGGTE